MVEHKKERLTADHQPAQGHHGAHEKPNAPYGREAQFNEEQAKHKEAEHDQDGEPPRSTERP